MPDKVINYTGLDGIEYVEELEPVRPSGLVLHATPDENIERIRSEGLCTGMPRVKCPVELSAIFCTIPGNPPHTSDLFRYYPDWSIVVIDTSLLPEHVWYRDFLAEDEMRSLGKPNNHILTFGKIPAGAIRKIIK